MFDAELYRDKAEVEQWKQRDPIALFQRRLREARATRPMTISTRSKTLSRTRSTRRCEFAEAGTWEPVEDLLKDVYAASTAPVTRAKRRSWPRRPIARPFGGDSGRR